MKRENLLLFILVLVCLLSAMAKQYALGYLLDINGDFRLSAFSENIAWGTLFFNLLVAVAAGLGYLLLSKRKKTTSEPKGRKRLCSFAALLLVAVIATVNIVNVVDFCRVARGQSFVYDGFELDLEDNYIDSDYLIGCTLAEINEIMSTGMKEVVYIGREDCMECKKFEAEIAPILEKRSALLFTYYTNLDREKPDHEEYQRFLKEYEIDSVPVLFGIENGEVYKKWDDPINALDEIEMFYGTDMKF